MVEILKDKIAVVTGAGRGIGRAVAVLMAKEGAKVLVNDYGISPDGTVKAPPGVEDVVAEIKRAGGEAIGNFDTVATPEGGENIINMAVEKLGGLHILVNNAGIVRDRMIFNLTQEEWDSVIKVNLYGLFHCTRPASSIMKQQRYGRIVNLSSGAGLGHVMGSSNYAAAKEGVVGFTRAVAADMFRYNVTCNAIRPLAVTRHFDLARKEAWLKQGRIESVEMMESSLPEDLAPFIVYLTSEEAAGITGRTFSLVSGNISLLSEPENFKTIFKAERWTIEELRKIVPKTVAASLFNRANERND